MEKLPIEIIKFIKRHHVLTLATVSNNIPYTSNMFYCFVEDKGYFVFTSDDNTKHINDVKGNDNVAINIVLETRIVGKIQGLQATGKIFKPCEEEMSLIKKSYLKKYPYAAVMELNLWVVEMKTAKLTDNALGFGKKIKWEK